MGIVINSKIKVSILVGLIAFLLVIGINYPEQVSKLKKEKTIDFDVNYPQNSLPPNYNNLKFFVPDYNAEIVYSPQDARDKKPILTKGEDFIFSISVVDTGFTKMKYPLFYILIFNPDDKIVMSFPNLESHEGRNRFKLKNYNNYNDIIKISLDNGGEYDIPREKLIQGDWDSFKILYRFKVEAKPEVDAGLWRAEVHVYDYGNYIQRNGWGLSNDFQDYDNEHIVAKKDFTFEVISKSKQKKDNLRHFKNFFEGVLALITVSTVFYALYDKLKDIWNKLIPYKWILILFLFILILYALFLNFFVCKCQLSFF